MAKKMIAVDPVIEGGPIAIHIKDLPEYSKNQLAKIILRMIKEEQAKEAQGDVK